jgi:hypothetical protein
MLAGIVSRRRARRCDAPAREQAGGSQRFPPGAPGRVGRSGRFNPCANSFQANPNKTKQKSLDFLGFVRPNRDFSMGYERKNKKNRLASQVVCKTSQLLSLSFFPRRAAAKATLIRRVGRS